MLVALAALDRTPYVLVAELERAARRSGARELIWLRGEPDPADHPIYAAEPGAPSVDVTTQPMRVGSSERDPVYVARLDGPPDPLVAGTAPGAVLVLLSERPFVEQIAGRWVVGLGPSGGGANDPHGRYVLLRLDEGEGPEILPRAVAWDLARLARRVREIGGAETLRHYLRSDEDGAQSSTKDRARGQSLPVSGLGRDTRDGPLLVGLLAPLVGTVFHPASAPWPDDDEEHVHRLRVATRRLRAALAIARPILGAGAEKRARLELRALGRRLGPRRAADVSRTLLRALEREEPWSDAERALLARADEFLQRRRRRVTRLIRAAHPPERALEEGLTLLGALMFPRTGAPNLEVAARAALSRRWGDLRRSLRAVRPPVDDEALHELRIATKRLRYTLELVHPALPDQAPRELIRRLKQLQDVLGRLHDHGELVALVAGPRVARGQPVEVVDRVRAVLLARLEALRISAVDAGRELAAHLAY